MRRRDTLIPITQGATACRDCPVRARALYQVVDNDYIHTAQSKRLEQYQLPARSSLYEEGDQPDLAFTLFSGWLMLYRAGMNGERQGLRIALPGDFVGFLPDTSPGARMNHAAVAITDSTLCGFRQHDLREMLHLHPQLAMQMTIFTSRDMAACSSTLLGMGRKSAEQRIAFVLLDLYDRLALMGAVDADTATMPFPLTQAMLGDLNGLSLVHTNRVMRRLAIDKVIECQDQTVVILDRDRLAGIGEYGG